MQPSKHLVFKMALQVLGKRREILFIEIFILHSLQFASYIYFHIKKKWKNLTT